MSILGNKDNEQEERIQSEFLKQYNKELNESVNEIEQGNFALHSDVEKLLADRRETAK